MGEENNQDITADLFEKWLSEGALVLLDGLDEISDAQKRKRVCGWIDAACNAYGESQFVVTTRYAGLNFAEGIRINAEHIQAEVLDLNESQQETFLSKWFDAAYCDEQKLSIQQRTEIDPATQAKEVSDAILAFLVDEQNESLRRLARSPVLLQIMAILWKEYKGLVAGRAALYEKATDYLLDRRDRVRGIEPLLQSEHVKMLLRPLGLMMQENLTKDEISEEDLLTFLSERIEEIKPGLDPGDFVDNLCQRAGIIKRFSDDHYIFSHKSFREFFAAGQLAEQVQRKSDRVKVLVRNFEDNWWRETLVFALTLPKPVILPDFLKHYLPAKINEGAFPPLLEQIIKEAPQKSVEPFQKFLFDGRVSWQRKYNALLCLRLFGSKQAIALVEAFEKQSQEPRLKQKALEILNETQTEYRPKPKTPTERPAVLAPDGTAEGDGLLRHATELSSEYIPIKGRNEEPGFFLARYPVTNKLYRRFLNYLAGQLDLGMPVTIFQEQVLTSISNDQKFIKHLKSQEAWHRLFASKYDDDKRFNGEDQPVVGINWYAATTYCLWLTALNTASAADNKYNFRLPEEPEWEWAASGGQREYPWGNQKPSKDLANYQHYIGKTSTVGSYPAGATPEGLMDMAGNVWEWQSNWYGKDAGARALRGGSWYFNAVNLRCSDRYWYYPDFRHFNFGFRVLLSQSK